MRLNDVIDPEKYTHMRVYYDSRRETVWFRMAATPIPCFLPELLNDLNRLFEATAEYNLSSPSQPVKYVIAASGIKGVFNLGGNLALFVECIKTGDRAALQRYTYNCIRAMLNSSQSFHYGAITIGLVEGDALGGGFEAALSCNLIVAEAQARFQFPERIFDLFPGMGAFDYLTRIIGPARALSLMQSSTTYTARQMHAMHCIDRVVASGAGVTAVQQLIDKQSHGNWLTIIRQNYERAPLDIDSIMEIAGLWVERAMAIDRRSLTTMGRIAGRQQRHAWSLLAHRM